MLSPQSVSIFYAGPELASGQHLEWKVRVWDGGDQASEWSKTAIWQMGLLTAADWTARWISPPHPPALRPEPA